MRTVLSRHQQEEVPSMWKADRALWKGTGDFRMSEPPEHRQTECDCCATCNHAKWDFKPPIRVVKCEKYDCITRDYMVCDSWEKER
jgi:hypothetical protein